MFVDTKQVIRRCRKSNKNTQYSGQKENNNNKKQTIIVYEAIHEKLNIELQESH
jgi:hypothetical protein